MAAYNYTQPPDATGQQLTSHGPNAQFEVFPNFNGQASIPYNGNFAITATGDIPRGALWTAHYALAGANTITIQFTTPLVSASTTASDYTLSGTAAPSISSVVFNAGSRNILLNLSGALVSTNTYTLKIANNKAITGTQIAYSQPQWGIYNWPNLVVDVIQPATIACTGVGIQQDILLGDPSMNTTNAAQGVGIQQDILLGDPVVSTLLSTIGVGIQQDVLLGSPVLGLAATCTVPGIAQTTALGSPAIVQQEMPVGVGFSQPIDLGNPVADITPLTTTGTGIQQTVGIGTPVAAGPANAIGFGISQVVALGTPSIFNGTQYPVGVGIDQLIDVGTPNSLVVSHQYANGLGVSQPVDLGTPQSSQQQFVVGVGVDQPIDVGVPEFGTIFNVGISQPVDLGMPTALLPLTLTAGQAAALVDIDTALHEAFSNGVDGAITPTLITPIDGYSTTLTLLQQYQTRLIFEELAAATMVTLNIPGVLPTTGTSVTVPVAKITPLGTDGSLTFVDGVLTSKVEPT